jgi:hypothetical protein
LVRVENILQAVHLYLCLPKRLPHFIVAKLPHAQHLNRLFFDIKIKFIENVFNKPNTIYSHIDTYTMNHQPFLAYIPYFLFYP